MTTGGGPTVRRRQLMAELRRLREATRLTQDEVASQLDWHPTKVMRIETGRTAPHPNDVRVMLGLYGVTDADAVAGLIKLAKDARQRGWWYSYRDVLLSRYEFFIGLESEAATIRDFGLAMIPGLLQTEDYARALIRGLMTYDAAEIERRVEVRMTRQELLAQPDRPQLWAILDEAAVRRVVGGQAIMRPSCCTWPAAPSTARPRSRSCPTARARTRAWPGRSSCSAWPSRPSPRWSTWRPWAAIFMWISPRKSACIPPPLISSARLPLAQLRRGICCTH